MVPHVSEMHATQERVELAGCAVSFPTPQDVRFSVYPAVDKQAKIGLLPQGLTSCIAFFPHVLVAQHVLY